MDVVVRHNSDDTRYEARVDDELAGFALYRVRSDALVFTHTEVRPELRGKGVASALVGAALADVRERGGRVIPLCWFVADYIRRYPEFVDLVAARHRETFDRETESIGR